MARKNIVEKVKELMKKMGVDSVTLNLGILGIDFEKGEEVSPGLVGELLVLRRVLNKYHLKLEIELLDEELEEIVADGDQYVKCELEECMIQFLRERQEILYNAFLEFEDVLYKSERYIELRQKQINKWMDLLEIFDYVRKLEYNYQNDVDIEDDQTFDENLIALSQIFRDIKQEIEQSFDDLTKIEDESSEIA